MGFFLMNAMPHLLFGLIRLRFLSLFGFSARGNLLYALVNILIALSIYHVQYDISTLLDDGLMIGALAMLAIYAVTGRFFVRLFQENN
jgi:hypothetical protein